MENEPNKPKTIIIAVAMVLIIVAGAGFWYWSKQDSPVPSSQTKEAPTLGSEIFDKTQNQLQGQVPDTNPFKDQKNPLDVMYKNPFE